MINQHGLTVRVPVRPGAEHQLKEYLNGIGTDVIKSGQIPFSKFQTLHYCRFVMVAAATFGKRKIPPSLVLSTNYDGSLGNHLNELCDAGGTALDTILSFCEGYPSAPSIRGRVAYLRKHTIPTTTFYTSTRGRSVDQVRKECQLYSSIGGDFLNQEDFSTSKPEAVVKAIKKFVGKRSGLNWALNPSKRYPLSYYLRYYGEFIAVCLLLLLLLPLIIFPIAPWWYLSLKYHEKKDTRVDRLIPADREKELADREDILLQNQMSHLVDVKPGFFRQFTLRFVLWAVGFLGRYLWNKGELGGIPTIHFARWVLLDGGKRLLFFSNFDGSWQSYLGDFVDKASIGLTGVWTNTVNFPKTTNLINAGARAEEPFKRWARYQQIPSQIWYTAYPNNSVVNINNQTKVRERIGGKSGKESDADWLRRF